MVAALFILSGGAVAGAEDKPVLIGAPIPLTGPYASDGEQMKMALELAVHEKKRRRRAPGTQAGSDLR